MISRFLIYSSIFFLGLIGFSQELDSLQLDTVLIVNPQKKVLIDKDQHIELFTEMSTLDPKRSAMLSAVLPGLGQIYNKQYWKVPLIYGGALIIGHYIRYQDRLYTSFRSAYFAATDLDPTTENPYPVSADLLLRNAEQLRRDRDYLMIIGGIFYLLQIVDAHVSAHLHEFQINDALSLDIQPAIQPSALISRSIGVSFSLRF
jgi:hypothetical protein